MKSTPSTRYGAPPRPFPFAQILVGLTGVVLVAGVLLWQGIIPWPFGKTPAPPSHEGQVAIPVSTRVIPIYSKVVREDLVDPATSAVKVIWIPKALVDKAWLTDPSRIIGRVTSHEKPASYVFTEEDFLPKNTRPGLVAGTPPGKRAIALDADKIRGVVHGLKAGDHLDLLASHTVDVKGDARAVLGNKHPEAMYGLPAKQAQVQVLVHNGVVISPVPPPHKGPTRTANNRPDHEIVIGVEPEEVAPLSEAMASNMDIFCIARSGQPDDPGESSVTPGSKPPPLPKVTVVETIHGDKHETLIFPEPPPEETKPRPVGENSGRVATKR